MRMTEKLILVFEAAGGPNVVKTGAWMVLT